MPYRSHKKSKQLSELTKKTKQVQYLEMLRPESSSASSVTLADLKPGESGEVTGYEQAHDPLTQRLMHLGVLRGRLIEVVRRAPAGDPLEVHIGHSSLLLRRNEAARIRVQRTPSARVNR